jgi:hypothetical protein
MDGFLDLFWNLDQIRGWAETRDSELVRAAGFLITFEIGLFRRMLVDFVGTIATSEPELTAFENLARAIRSARALLTTPTLVAHVAAAES